MASIQPVSIAAGVPVDQELDSILSQLAFATATLVESRICHGLGAITCNECTALWLVGEPPRHVPGCQVGAASAALLRLREFLQSCALNGERSSAERVSAGAAGGDRPRRVLGYGEPLACGMGNAAGEVLIVDAHHRMVATVYGYTRHASEMAARIAAAVNFCADVPASTLKDLIPLRELGIGVKGAGIDALLGKKGGAA